MTDASDSVFFYYFVSCDVEEESYGGKDAID